MKKLILAVTIGATTFGLNTRDMNAGDWGKTPVGKSPLEECIDLGGEISAGYETDYVFYGVRFARDSVWTDVNYTFDSLAVPVTVGAWYLNGINGGGSGYDELNLYADLALGSFAGFDVTTGYTHYIFPEARSTVANTGGYGEVNLSLSRSLGFVDLTVGSAFAFGGGGTSRGWYHELGLEKTFELTDRISFVLGGGVAFSDGYFGESGWNHYFAKASLPIALNCRTTLTPYLGYVGATDGMIADGNLLGVDGPQSDILHGGVSLTVSF